MKRLYSLLTGGFLLSLIIVSCQQGPKPMDAAMMTAKADSVAQSRMQTVADSMMKDCTTNQEMMVEMKADSMYNASLATNASASK